MKKVNLSKKQLLSFSYCLLYMIASIIFPHTNDFTYKATVIVIGITGILQAVKKGNALHLSRIDEWWIFFIIWSAFSLLWSNVLAIDRLIVFLFIEFNLIFLGNYLSTEEKCIHMLKAYMLSGVFFGIYLIHYTTLRIIIMSGRLPNDRIDSNEAGVIFSFSIILALFFWLKEKKKWYLLLAALLEIMVFLSGSRSAFLNSTCSVIVFFLVYNKGKFKIRDFLLFILGIAGLFYVLMNVEVFYNIIGRRIEGMWNIITGETSVMSGSLSGSTYLRANLYIMSWRTFLEHPLGVGLDNFRYTNRFIRGAHSNILELLSSLGFIGAILFYAMYIQFIILFLNVERILDQRERAMILGFLTGSFVISLFNSYYNIFSHFVLLIIFYTELCLKREKYNWEIEYESGIHAKKN